MKAWSSRVVTILILVWTLGCALLPIHLGNELGMPRTLSCGPAIANLVKGGLSEYGPAMGQACQNNAQDRVVLWLAYAVPVVGYTLLRRLRQRLTFPAGVSEPMTGPRWADALTYAACILGWAIVPVVVYFVAKDRALRRNAARAIELQLLLPAVALWLFALAPLSGDRGLSWLAVPGLFLAAVTASVGTLLCAILALVAPARLEVWQPLLARRNDASSPGVSLQAAA